MPDRELVIEDDNTQVAPEMGAETPVSEEPSTEEAGTKTEEGMKEFAPGDKEKSYLELEQKMTKQGQELSEYRKFYDDVSPVVDAIQNDEELLNTVLDKLYGKDEKPGQPEETAVETPVEDAKATTAQNASSQADVMSAVESKLKNFQEQQSFERKVEKFIETHPDFNEKLPKILEVIDKHQINDDIELAYKLVEHAEMQGKLKDLNEAKEEAKNQAMGVGGASGGSKGSLPSEESVWDLLAKPTNPNSAFGTFDK